MANFERMKIVLDAIEADPESHNMSKWASDCGTTMCIGGRAVSIFDPEEYRIRAERQMQMYGPACDVLGLDGYTGSTLFYCNDEHALPYLSWMVENESTNWTDFLEEFNHAEEQKRLLDEEGLYAWRV